MPVSLADPAYYPINSIGCCSPGLLLSNGDALELERCSCRAVPGVNCGAQADDTLLMGFVNYRLSHIGFLVPIAPAECCQLCLTGATHHMEACADLSNCRGRGVCVMGSCECMEGWTGADCGQQVCLVCGGVWCLVLECC